MTGHLFIDHFVAHVNKQDGISPTYRHLVILDGHGLHVTMDVGEKAWSMGVKPEPYPLILRTRHAATGHVLFQIVSAIFALASTCLDSGKQIPWSLQGSLGPVGVTRSEGSVY